MAERNTIGSAGGRSSDPFASVGSESGRGGASGQGHRRTPAGGSVDLNNLIGVRSSQENIAASMVISSNRSKSNALTSMFERKKTDVVGMKSVLTVSSAQRNSTENLGRSALLPGQGQFQFGGGRLSNAPIIIKPPKNVKEVSISSYPPTLFTPVNYYSAKTLKTCQWSFGRSIRVSSMNLTNASHAHKPLTC